MRAGWFVGLAVAPLLGGCVYTPGQAYIGVAPAQPVYYDSYYDGYYGPVTDGYWRGNAFFYADRGRHWHRDDGRHFRPNGGPGYGHLRTHGDHRR